MIIATHIIMAYLVGSLPIGKFLLKRLTGQEPRVLSGHSLGWDNLLKLAKSSHLLLSIGVDFLKALLVMLLCQGSPWAAFGLYLGHLYPPFSSKDLRGRGHVLVFGLVTGLWLFGGLELAIFLLALAMYGLTLLIFAFPSISFLSGLLVLLLGVAIVQQKIVLTSILFAIFLLAVWRHKAHLVRIVNGLEPKLGQAIPVRGVDPNTVTTAFMVHPMTISDWWQPPAYFWIKYCIKLLPFKVIKDSLTFIRPQKVGQVDGIALADGRKLNVMLIGCALLPEQIREAPERATKVAIQGARLAQELGAEAFGLGAFWSTVGEKGLQVQEAVPDINITNGGALTAGTVKAAVPMLLDAFAETGVDLAETTVAIVGANGVVAFGVARSIAPEFKKIILIGTTIERLERSANTLRKKYPDKDIQTSTDIAACKEAQLIITATSDPNPVIYPEHVSSGAWLYDLGRPADVDATVAHMANVTVIPGGVIRPPGEAQTTLDMHFGEHCVPACMAETMIMTAMQSWDRKSLGAKTKTENINYYLDQAERLGFQMVMTPVQK